MRPVSTAGVSGLLVISAVFFVSSCVEFDLTALRTMNARSCMLCR